MTCKNCLYFEKCQHEYFEFNKPFKDTKFLYIGDNKSCKYFKNRKNFIELPFNKEYISDVTKSVYVISENEIVECFVKYIEIKKYLNELVYLYHCIDSDISCLPFHYTCELGKNMFLTREGAERALEEWEDNGSIY